MNNRFAKNNYDYHYLYFQLDIFNAIIVVKQINYYVGWNIWRILKP